jgi:cell division protein DivIC
LATYTKTKKYAEEVAKDKLGLVYEDEIIFQETN